MNEEISQASPCSLRRRFSSLVLGGDGFHPLFSAVTIFIPYSRRRRFSSLVLGGGRTEQPLKPVKGRQRKELSTTWVINCGKSKKQETVQDYYDNSIKIGTRVHIFCLRIPKTIVAQGVVVDLIGDEKKDGHAFVKVYVENALIPNEKLLRPHEGDGDLRDIATQVILLHAT
ncbi:hypothetical protein BUALT_Bualt05G0069600 [Buddleja alternifolia]|uniref:Uncharacterized protein n=1 Tax=Buddleja alternifolia TaxID=168488 RepID=A0AAV6XJ60_9LAMI|nr:hypothetical protein BUALT_Bualt05G0069600 [Buddleja alternifolia]